MLIEGCQQLLQQAESTNGAAGQGHLNGGGGSPLAAHRQVERLAAAQIGVTAAAELQTQAFLLQLAGSRLELNGGARCLRLPRHCALHLEARTRGESCEQNPGGIGRVGTGAEQGAGAGVDALDQRCSLGCQCRTAIHHTLLDHDRIPQHGARCTNNHPQAVVHQEGAAQVEAAHLAHGGWKRPSLIGAHLTAHQLGRECLCEGNEAAVEAEGSTRHAGGDGEAALVAASSGHHRGGKVDIGVDRIHQPLPQQGHRGVAGGGLRDLQAQHLLGVRATCAVAQVHHITGAVAAGESQGAHLRHGIEGDGVNGAAGRAGSSRGAHLQREGGRAGAGREQGATLLVRILTRLHIAKRCIGGGAGGLQHRQQTGTNVLQGRGLAVVVAAGQHRVGEHLRIRRRAIGAAQGERNGVADGEGAVECHPAPLACIAHWNGGGGLRAAQGGWGRRQGGIDPERKSGRGGIQQQGRLIGGALVVHREVGAGAGGEILLLIKQVGELRQNVAVAGLALGHGHLVSPRLATHFHFHLEALAGRAGREQQVAGLSSGSGPEQGG